MSNPLLQLRPLGQSLWYDNIDRAQIKSGQLHRLLEEDGVVGVTANPTTFEKAIRAGHAYDEQMYQLMETIEHFRDHGQVHLSIEHDLVEASNVLTSLEQVGISYEKITQQLQEEGIQKFAASFSAMYQGAQDKQRAMGTV